MSFLNAAINNVKDEFLKEQLQDRVDIIGHKIKFMDRVPLIVLNSDNEVNPLLNELLTIAGGDVVAAPVLARVLIYQDQLQGMTGLMGAVPALLEKEWPAVEFSRLYLMDTLNGDFKDPQYLVSILEDLAEILYPGYFIFGTEGKNWMSFGV